uniref:Uncharacterized protein n=1 Tax=Anopheles coluzzii TaxID=1518534 RepID=A0A8W7PST8_ANOCL
MHEKHQHGLESVLTLEGDAAEEEYDQHDVREDGRDVDDLARLGNALHHAQVDERPGGDECQRDRVVDLLRLVDARRHLERFAIPVVLGRRRHHTLRLDVVGEVLKQPLRTFGPRQRRFEAVQQIDQAPGNDGVVVERHDVADEGGGDADTAEVGGHLVPHTDRTLAQALPDRELQIEDWQALQQQHYEVRHQECTAAIFLRQIREAPHVTKPNGLSRSSSGRSAMADSCCCCDTMDACMASLRASLPGGPVPDGPMSRMRAIGGSSSLMNAWFVAPYTTFCEPFSARTSRLRSSCERNVSHS